MVVGKSPHPAVALLGVAVGTGVPFTAPDALPSKTPRKVTETPWSLFDAPFPPHPTIANIDIRIVSRPLYCVIANPFNGRILGIRLHD
jgi:hypothetical protein